MDKSFTSNMGLFRNLDMYLIRQIYQCLNMKDLLSLTQTCREMSIIGQIVLHQTYQKLKDQPPTEIHNEIQVWKDVNNRLHREYDLPAIIFPDGREAWFRHGLHHRGFDRPAFIDPKEGILVWHQFDQIHRDHDRPAFIKKDHHQAWYRYSQFHRDHDQPALIYADGAREWYQAGYHHRDGDQPAIIEIDGTQSWYRHGQHHRDNDQPAVIKADGKCEWWTYGKQYDFQTQQLYPPCPSDFSPIRCQQLGNQFLIDKRLSDAFN